MAFRGATFREGSKPWSASRRKRVIAGFFIRYGAFSAEELLDASVGY
jgi:hypothetical protein